MKLPSAFWFLSLLPLAAHVASEYLRGHSDAAFEEPQAESLPGNEDEMELSRNLQKKGFPYTTNDPFEGATRKAAIFIKMKSAEVCNSDSSWRRREQSDAYVQIWLHGIGAKKWVGQTGTKHNTRHPHWNQWFNAGKFTDKEWKGEAKFEIKGRDWDKRSNDDNLGQGSTPGYRFPQASWGRPEQLRTNRNSDCGYSTYRYDIRVKATRNPYNLFHFPNEGIFVGKHLFAEHMTGADATLACELEGMNCCYGFDYIPSFCTWTETRSVHLQENRSPKFINPKTGFFEDMRCGQNNTFFCDEERYLGCFGDKKDRAMSKKLGYKGSNIQCIDGCGRDGYKYAGVQAGGNDCWCSNDEGYAKYGKYNDAKCGMKCKNGRGYCGDAWKNSVFKTRHYKCKNGQEKCSDDMRNYH